MTYGRCYFIQNCMIIMFYTKHSIVDLSGQPLTVIVAKYDLEDR